MPFSQAFFPAVSILIALLSFACGMAVRMVKKQPVSNERITHVGGLIRRGAKPSLQRNIWFAVCRRRPLIFLFLPSPIWKNDFIQKPHHGNRVHHRAVFSSIAGKRIQVATIANMRTAESAKRVSAPLSCQVPRRRSGMAVVGASLLGVTLVYLITDNMTALLGFSLAQARLPVCKAGGGIFTKTADISADLCGKVEPAFRRRPAQSRGYRR